MDGIATVFRSIFSTLRLGKHALTETVILSVLIFAISYFLNPEDILFLHTNILISVIFFSVLSLFYGLTSGLLSLALFSLLFVFMRLDFEYRIFLELLVLVLVFGEFRYYWQQKILELESLNTVLDDQLRRLSNAFYTLKVSHDQLEMNYVLTPVNLRASLESIVKIDNDKPFEELYALLEKTFQLKRFAICTIHNGEPYIEASSTIDDSVDTNDTLYLAAIEHAAPAYVSQHTQDAGRYIAAIPSVRNDETNAMILIEEMPFMAFDQDNLTAINFIFDFFMYRLEEKRVLTEHPDIFPQLENDFRFQFIHLQHLYLRYHVNSAIIAIKSVSHLTMHLLYENVLQTSRILDKTTLFVNGEGQHILLILTPFMAAESARGLQQRVLQAVKEDDTSVNHAVFSISQVDLLYAFISPHHHEGAHDD
jgi:hypothetical protein